MKYHLDEAESQVVAVLGHRRYRLEVTSSHELGLDGMTDSELLRYCGLQERCIVTKNGRDYIALTRRFQAESLPHAGVRIIPRSMGNDEFDRIARALAWYREQYPDGVPAYFVDYLRDPPEDWQEPTEV